MNGNPQFQTGVTSFSFLGNKLLRMARHDHEDRKWDFLRPTDTGGQQVNLRHLSMPGLVRGTGVPFRLMSPRPCLSGTLILVGKTDMLPKN